MSQQDDDGIRVGATATAFRVIEAVKQLDSPGVSEVARSLEMPKTTAYDHLETLCELGYVTPTEDGYRVGARFLDLGGYARKQMKIYQVGKPEVAELASKTGEHANLMIEEHGLGIFLYKSKGEKAVQLDTYAGHHVLLQTTALGKAILAHLPEERVDEIIEQYGFSQITENTITDRERLKEELETIRDRGYATDHEERVEGMWCVAAPIIKSDGIVAGALSVSGPKNRMEGERFEEELPEQVLRSANVVEVNLTYS